MSPEPSCSVGSVLSILTHYHLSASTHITSWIRDRTEDAESRVLWRVGVWSGLTLAFEDIMGNPKRDFSLTG